MKFILSLLLLIPSFAHAYKPEVGHSKILPLAHKLLQTCKLSAGDFYSENDIEIMKKASTGIDSGDVDFSPETGKNPFSLWSRILNWHFYNGDMPNGETFLWFIEKSYKNTWSLLSQGYDNTENKTLKLTYLGGMAHFIEDMANPAHVIPAFHMIGIKDGIDDFEPNHKTLLTRIKGKHLCNVLSENLVDSNPISIRDWAVKKTYKELEQKIPRCPDFRWSNFYDKAESGQFFGDFHTNPSRATSTHNDQKYNRKTFYIGDEGKLVSNANSNLVCDFKSKDPRYNKFITQLFENAIIADALLLISQQPFLNNKLSGAIDGR